MCMQAPNAVGSSSTGGHEKGGAVPKGRLQVGQDVRYIMFAHTHAPGVRIGLYTSTSNNKTNNRQASLSQLVRCLCCLPTVRLTACRLGSGWATPGRSTLIWVGALGRWWNINSWCEITMATMLQVLASDDGAGSLSRADLRAVPLFDLRVFPVDDDPVLHTTEYL